MDLQLILERHKLWLQTGEGEKADLQGADLREADLRGAVLREAVLREADLEGADLRWTNLEGADLREADLREADLDFSSGIPFHCGGTEIIGDERLFAQMVYHLTRQDWQHIKPEYQSWLNSIPEEIKDLFKQYREDV